MFTQQNVTSWFFLGFTFRFCLKTLCLQNFMMLLYSIYILNSIKNYVTMLVPCQPAC